MNESNPQALTAEQAVVLRNYFLPVLATSHKVSRRLIQDLPADKLDYKPEGAELSLGDVVWSLISTEAWYLAGILAGAMPEPSKKPETITVPALLAFADEHFSPAYDRLASLSSDDLLTSMEFLGVSVPAIELLQSCLATTGQLKGRIATYLQIADLHVAAPDATVTAHLNGTELTEAELSEVAGGVTVVPHYYTATAQQLGWFPPPQTQATLSTALTGNAHYQWSVSAAAAGGIPLAFPAFLPEILIAIFAPEFIPGEGVV